MLLDVEGLKRVLMALANWALEARGNLDLDLSQSMADVFFVQELPCENSSSNKRVGYETESLKIWCDLLARILELPPIETPAESMTEDEAAQEVFLLSESLHDRIVAAMGLLTPAEREEITRQWSNK